MLHRLDVTRPPLLQRLRDETRSEHDAIERDMDWERRVATRAGYAAMLARHHGFHRAWEPVVTALLGEGVVAPRRKLALLAADLRALGWPDAAIDALPACDRIPALADATEALGSMYVIEGSTLGGQVIRRHVADTLAFEGAYHGSYARETGAMWRAFQTTLAAGVAPADEDRAVDAARRTFVAMREWMIAGD